MQVNRALEQHIAVFGESGSGKTVLVSSFYGPSQDKGFAASNHFGIKAVNSGQGARLHRNYLGMRNSAAVPSPTRFASTSYAFDVTPSLGTGVQQKQVGIDALRLVWHDYPGEWFEEDVESDEEKQRRLDTFRALLGSDVALLLVDAQRLIDNAGEEERYLKSLFGNYYRGLELLKDDLLQEGEPLVVFPRIWMVALSKSDLLPDLDAYALRELVNLKAADDVDRLRQLIGELVQAKEALSIAEDFVLLSSAKFTPGQIEVAERVGVDLILPLAAILPFERFARWAKLAHLPQKVLAEFLDDGMRAATIVLTGGKFAARFASKFRLPNPFAFVIGGIAALVASGAVDDVVKMSIDKIAEMNRNALAKHQYLTAMLTKFRLDLRAGEDGDVLLRGDR